jgi:chemotaxis protein MotA
MLLILGTLVVLGSVVGGFLLHGGEMLVLVQPSEFLIIGGASIGSLLISTPPKLIRMLVGQLRSIFGRGYTPGDFLELLALQYQLFRVIQQNGVMALESHVENPEASPILVKYPTFVARHHAAVFLFDSLKIMILGGIAVHDLEALMDEDLHVHHEETLKPSGTLARVSDALPGLGIVAAVLGVVITMQAIDGPPAEIGHKVAAALVGTFLGILLSYGFVGPLSTHLEHMVAEEGRYLQCLKVGILSAYKGLPPAVAVEFARRALPSDLRPSFDETERICRAAAKPDAQAAAA